MEVEIYGIAIDELENWAIDWFTNQDYREGLSSLYIDEYGEYIVMGWEDSITSEYFDWLVADLQKEFIVEID